MSKKNGRSDTDKAIRGVMNYLNREPWNARFQQFLGDVLTNAADFLEMDVGDISAVVERPEYQDMFFGVVFEEFITMLWDDEDVSLLDEYLKRRGWKESARGRRYLERINQSRLRMWEVVDVKPRAWVEIRPFGMDEKSMRVFEKSGTANMVKWDCVLARPLEIFDRMVFSGGLLPLEQSDALMVQEMLGDIEEDARRSIEKMDAEGELFEGEVDIGEEEKRELTEAMALFATVESYFEVMLHAWLARLVDGIMQSFPSIANRDGEALLFAVVRVPFPPEQREEVIGLLDQADDFDFIGEKGDERWNWIVEGGDAASPEGVPLLGSLCMKEGRLELSANSRERGERGAARLRELLGDLVGKPLISYRDPEQAMEEWRASGAPAAAESAVSIDPEMEEELVDQFKGDHYRKTMEQSLPLLDGYTPRECAANPELRPLLVSWLKTLENNEERMARSKGATPYDTAWLWEELGLDKQ